MPPEREKITHRLWCDLSQTWGIDQNVAHRLSLSAADFFRETNRDVWIISGARTRQEQDLLRRHGRPAAADSVSTHRSCPATGADISFGFGATVFLKETWGRIVNMNGLRWGGGSAVDSDGLPVDWQHVDAGPRLQLPGDEPLRQLCESGPFDLFCRSKLPTPDQRLICRACGLPRVTS